MARKKTTEDIQAEDGSVRLLAPDGVSAATGKHGTYKVAGGAMHVHPDDADLMVSLYGFIRPSED